LVESIMGLLAVLGHSGRLSGFSCARTKIRTTMANVSSIGFFGKLCVLPQFFQIDKLKLGQLTNWIGGLALILVVVSGVFHTQSRMHYRATEPAWNNLPEPSFFDIEPYLGELGVPQNALVYSPTDPSPNVSLYYLNRTGFSHYGMNANEAVKNGVQYFILSKEELLKEEYAHLDLGKIGQWKDLEIFRLGAPLAQ